MVSVVLSLGSNLGNRGTNIGRMLCALEKILVPPLRKSNLMETEPVDVFEDQPYFYNLLICADYNSSPERLLLDCNEIELMMGRDNKKMLAPRIADIDILLYSNRSIKTESLTIPHPAILKRRFCIEGLNQLVPDWVIPGKDKKINQFHNNMKPELKNQKIRFLKKFNTGSI